MNLGHLSHAALQETIEQLRRESARKDELIKASLVDRQQLDERLRFEQLLLALSATFVNLPATEVEAHIQQGLKQIVEALDVDRSTFLKVSDDGVLFVTVASYAKIGFSTLPSFRAHEEFPWSVERLKRGEPVCWSKFEDFPEEAGVDKESFRRYGLFANMNIPISCEGRIKFVLSAGSMQGERHWPEALFSRLRLLGEIFANALLRGRKEEELAVLHKRLRQENIYLQEELNTNHDFTQIIGQSDVLRYALYRVKQVAPTDTSVLIQGETGTGKELVARAIHQHSVRKDRPLIKVNCAALPANLIESELFGHHKGAFTGAVADRKGRFELADGATLFLDEIGELPLELQAKLLQVLESGEFERLGSSQTCQVDIRLITATNRDLEQEVEAGRFREDLWHRLNVFLITVPPLRERVDDIPLLVSRFMNAFNQRLGKEVDELSPTTLETLQAYSWPGNVRELQHVIERAMILSPGSRLQLADPLVSRNESIEQNTLSTDQFQDFEGLQAAARQDPLHEVEREYILRILEKTYWRVNGPDGAAKILGLNPNTLRGRMRKLGIQRPTPNVER